MIKKVINEQNVSFFGSVLLPLAAIVLATLSLEKPQPITQPVRNDQQLLMPTSAQSTGYFVSHNQANRR
ncbi:MAG: hypothetical protein SVT56_06040 [Chloroflexota bacterium]|jgi:hypothetical protein|nr:hypothetical protein [Chloroflexota bacterium]